jgi:FkbM family methyltransferase
MRYINSIVLRLRNIITHDRFSWINKDRSLHLDLLQHLDRKFHSPEPLIDMGNYALTQSILDSLNEDSIVLSGGVEFHIDFEEELSKVKNPIIHFFEVDPRSFDWFKKNYSTKEKFILHELGLGDSESKFPVYGSPNQAWSSAIDQNLIQSSTLNYQIIGEAQTTTIPIFCSKHSIETIDLLKLDIEGFALITIRTAWAGKVFPKTILFEIERGDNEPSASYFDEVYSIINEAKGYGYKVIFVPRTDGYTSQASQFILTLID